MRLLPGVGILVLALTSCGGLAGHSASSRTPPGVLTGTAQACSGLLAAPVARLEVYRVTGRPSGQGSATVRFGWAAAQQTTFLSSQQVRNGGTYRFVLAPGRYDITNTGELQSGFYLTTSIESGRVRHLDVPDVCM
jgi:hypothetical protein